MDKITISDLLSVDLAREWQGSAASWEKFLRVAEQNGSALEDAVMEPIRENWSGNAAEHFGQMISTTRRELIFSVSQLKQTAAVLEDFATQLTVLQSLLISVIDEAHRNGFTVRPDGSIQCVQPVLNPGDSAATQSAQMTCQRKIVQIVERAARLDNVTAKTLDKLMPVPPAQAKTPKKRLRSAAEPRTI